LLWKWQSYWQSRRRRCERTNLLVERLGVGGGGRDIGVTGSLVGASGELELVGGLQVGVAGCAVGGGVVLQKALTASKKPLEGDETIGFQAAAVCASKSLPQGRKEGRTFLV
jgi:hypothetical protein